MPGVIEGLSILLVSVGVPTALAGPIATVLTIGGVSRDGCLVQRPSPVVKP